MRQSLDKLAISLREQSEALGAILELSREVRSIVVEKDVRLLGTAVRKELNAIKKMNAIADNTRAAFEAVTVELNLKENCKTIGEIISHLEPDERMIIQTLRDELTINLEELAELNIDNQEYIETRLEYSEYLVDLIVAEEDPLNNFYGDEGYTDFERKKSGFFDSQA